MSLGTPGPAVEGCRPWETPVLPPPHTRAPDPRLGLEQTPRGVRKPALLSHGRCTRPGAMRKEVASRAQAMPSTSDAEHGTVNWGRGGGRCMDKGIDAVPRGPGPLNRKGAQARWPAAASDRLVPLDTAGWRCRLCVGIQPTRTGVQECRRSRGRRSSMAAASM